MRKFIPGAAFDVDCSTLVEVLQKRAQDRPERQAFTFLLDGETEAVSITYGDLDKQARSIAARLQSAGQMGDRALLLYPPGLEFIAAYFGCLYSGIIAVPVYPPHPLRLQRTMPKIAAVIEDAEPSIVLTTSLLLDKVAASFMELTGPGPMRWLATDDIPVNLAENWQEPGIRGDSLAFLQYTSGSTTLPRGVMVSHGNLLGNLDLIRRYYEHTPDSQGVIWLPPYHDMGLIGGILQPLYSGFPVTLMSPLIFLQRPFRWLQAISRFKATTSGGPNFAYDMCVRKVTPQQRDTLDLSSWDVAFNGAEPIDHKTLVRFIEYFEPCGFRPEAFYPCYGLAEATLMVSGGLKKAGPIVQSFHSTAMEQNKVVVVENSNDSARSLVGCGQTMPGQEIIIVDPLSLKLCPEDQIGEIWISGPSVARGYWNRPDETEHTFNAYEADTKKGPFLRTGDLGFLKDGQLFVAGRIKDLIIIDGSNHYPQDIERTVERSHKALRAGGCAAFSIPSARGEQLVIAAEVRRVYQPGRLSPGKAAAHHDNANARPLPDINEVVKAVRKAVSEHHDLRVHDIVLLKEGRIPKTSSGKSQRYACKKQYLSGTLEVLAV